MFCMRKGEKTRGVGRWGDFGGSQTMFPVAVRRPPRAKSYPLIKGAPHLSQITLSLVYIGDILIQRQCGRFISRRRRTHTLFWYVFVSPETYLHAMWCICFSAESYPRIFHLIISPLFDLPHCSGVVTVRHGRTGV